MSREEIAYKLIELYYTNKNTFNNYHVDLSLLSKIYKEVLDILKGDSNELLNK